MLHRHVTRGPPSALQPLGIDPMQQTRSKRRRHIERRTRRALFFAIVAVFIVYQQTSSSLISSLDYRPVPVHVPLKQILFYNSFWNWPDFRVGYGQEPFSQCRIKTCFTSSKPENQSLLQNMSDFDAIVIHGMDFRLDGYVDDYIQSWRKAHQRLVFFMLEPSTFGPMFSSSGYNHFWNYTMTYRRESDIVRPYGFIVPKNDRIRGGISKAGRDPRMAWPVDYNETDFILNVLPSKGSDFLGLAKKPKNIAWVVSNCQTKSRREDFVDELKKHIDVDVFGKCGTAVCDFEGAQAFLGNCSTTIKKDYKFYLSLENTFARDYVTEKFFLRLNDNLLPIVLGQADYSRTAPPHSFINVLDYNSPKALADFLHRLDANDAEYLSYFWWKDYYHVESNDMQRLAFCDLCAKLHEDLEPKSYPNFEQWWHTDSQIDQKLPKLLAMIGEEVPEPTKQTPRLRMSFDK